MADRQWYTGRDGKQEGPFSDERLRELIASGMVRGDTLVWSAGMTNWAKASEVPGLMPARHWPKASPAIARNRKSPLLRRRCASAAATSSSYPVAPRLRPLR